MLHAGDVKDSPLLSRILTVSILSIYLYSTFTSTSHLSLFCCRIGSCQTNSLDDEDGRTLGLPRTAQLMAVV